MTFSADDYDIDDGTVIRVIPALIADHSAFSYFAGSPTVKITLTKA